MITMCVVVYMFVYYMTHKWECNEWIYRRKLDLKHKDMITQITIETITNQDGKMELVETWEYIRLEDRDPNAKELSGEKNKWLVDRTYKQQYPEWATNSKRLTATGANDWMEDRSIDKIYNKFKDWQHVSLKTAVIIGVVAIGVIYLLVVMSQ